MLWKVGEIIRKALDLSSCGVFNHFDFVVVARFRNFGGGGKGVIAGFGVGQPHAFFIVTIYDSLFLF